MPSRSLSPSIAVTVSVNSQCGSTKISRSPTLRLSMNMNVPLLWAPPGFTSQVTLCRLTCDLGSHSSTHPVETLHSVYGLHLCDAAVHKQFRPGDVAAVLGSEKNDRPGDLIGRAKPAERNAGENRLQTLSARSCGRQRVIESGGVGEASAHRVHADAPRPQVRRPCPPEATYCGLSGAGTATRPNPLLAPMAAFRMIEAPSGSSGSAFCTAKKDRRRHRVLQEGNARLLETPRRRG